MMEVDPAIPQVACFDTAFHRGHAAHSDCYALPRGLYDEGVRRYGFHGLSYEYIAERLHEVAPGAARGRAIVAHLGSGASMCALLGGRSVESTMGFTALDGLPMGTRPGQLDPGVVLYLIAQKGMSVQSVSDLLYRESGLKGLSGISNDVRELLASDDPRAAFAVDHFVYRCGLSAGLLAAALGGVDAFVFTAGIGENSAPDPRPYCRAARLARRRARPRRQRSRRHANLDARQPCCALRHPDQRGADDRAAHARPGRRRTKHSIRMRTSMTLPTVNTKFLEGRKGLIVGIANDRSIAWGCARAFRAFGAELAVTYLNDKAQKYVEPLAREVEATIFMPMDMTVPGQLEAVFERIGETWGALDFLVHSIAFSPRETLAGRVTDAPRDGFLATMDISCWSFIRMAHLAEPLMKNGGTLFTMTYYGSQMVVENYNIMGVAKAALESAVRYLAAELGPKGIRVHAISPGPLATRAASGISEFDELLEKAKVKAPARALVGIDDVGVATAFLAHDAARAMTGQVLYVDGGYHIVD